MGMMNRLEKLESKRCGATVPLWLDRRNGETETQAISRTLADYPNAGRGDELVFVSWEYAPKEGF